MENLITVSKKRPVSFSRKGSDYVNLRSLFLIFVVMVLMIGGASAATLAGPDPCNSLDNWTQFYTGTAVENGTIHLGSGSGRGVGWADDMFSGDRTVSFTYVDFDESTDEYFVIRLNGSLVAGEYNDGWRIRVYEDGSHRLYDPSGSYETFTNSQPIDDGDTVNISMNGTHVCVLVNGNSAGILTGGNESGYIEFRSIPAGADTGFDNFTVTDVLQMESESGGGDTTPGNTYYVSSSGSDSNNGTTLSTPYANIQTALDKDNPGDVIYIVDDGIYYNQTLDIGANNVSVLAYNGTPLLTSGTYLTGSDWTGKTFDSYIGNLGRHTNTTIRGLNFTYYSGGFWGFGSYTNISNCYFSEMAGRNTADTTTRATLDINADTYSDATGEPLHDIFIVNNYFGNEATSGSSSSNSINVKGDMLGRDAYNIYIVGNEKTGSLLHQWLNLLVQSQEYVPTATYGFLNITIQDNYVHDLNSAIPYGIAVLQGLPRNMYVSGEKYNAYAGFVGIVSNSVFENVTTTTLTGTTNRCIWIQNPTSGYEIIPRSNDTIFRNWVSLGNGYDGGYLSQRSDNITLDGCDFWRYTLRDGSTKVLDHNESQPTYYLITNDGRTADTVLINKFSNGRLFTEDATGTITINSTGSYLTVGNDEYVTIEMLDYSATPETSATVTNVSDAGCTVTLAGDETVTFTEISTGNTTQVSLSSGDSIITFSQLDFDITEYWTPTAGTHYIGVPETHSWIGGEWVVTYSGTYTEAQTEVTGVEIRP
jgi:hypothetical protein